MALSLTAESGGALSPLGKLEIKGMTDTKPFNKSHIYRDLHATNSSTNNATHNQKRNTELPEQAWYLPISSDYAQNIQNLLVKIEAEWMKELGQQYNQLLMYDPELAKDFPIPPSPLRYGEAVAHQIMRQDFRFLEVEAAALGFALIPLSMIHLFDPTQVRIMSNQGRVMEILNAYGTAEKTGGAM